MLNVQEQVSLKPYNTLALPSLAEYFCRVNSDEGLSEALAWAGNHRYPVTLLGGGSNVVLAGNLSGLVVQMAIPGVELISEKHHLRRIRVGAGENWHQLVVHALNQGWFGLENLSLIPGLVGAAPVQNIGAYGVELSERFHSLEAVHLNTGERHVMSRSDCKFAYRDSFFKGQGRDQFAITAITLELSSKPDLHIEYPALQQAIDALPEAELTPKRVSDIVCDIRRGKLPDPDVIPNAGSFFKNPIVSSEVAAKLKHHYPKLVSYSLDENRVKLAAGWLIDQAGWKGFERDGVGVYNQQSLVLINMGGSCDALMSLVVDIQSSVMSKFGITLDIEPRVYR